MIGNGVNMIHGLQRKWQRMSILSCVLMSLALAIPLMCLIKVSTPVAWQYIGVVWVFVFVMWLMLKPGWKITNQDVVVYLDKQHAGFEDSCGLLLKPELNMLEQLQAKKVTRELQSFGGFHPFRKKIRNSTLWVLAAILSGYLLMLIKPAQGHEITTVNNNTASGEPEKKIPGISAIQVTIVPPAYTHKSVRKQQFFNLQAEAGAAIEWTITTNQSLPSLLLLFNDSAKVQMQPQDSTHTTWRLKRSVNAAAFYQVKFANTLSDLYRLEIIPDKAPVITVQSPHPTTVIDFGQPKKVAVSVMVTDDYGISNAFMYATVASGSGEAVKFKEQKIGFPLSFAGENQRYNLQKTIDLEALKMEPGSELYFFISGTDTHGQETRSDMFIVSLPDTAELMSSDITLNGLNLKPEYFRSQRQIIIETEQLIKAKDTISEKVFKDRSNDLAIDQKLLRLRYGKFLGEESETNIGDNRIEQDEHHEEHGTQGNAGDFGNAAAVLDAYSHKHDIAEDATFFDAETKKQLRATLTEMWKAELQLRLFKPTEALPFEYKALRLLKDLQQQSRVYVAKTSIKMPPLKQEKRLTGELDKIISPVKASNAEKKDSIFQPVREALSILESVREKQPLTPNEYVVLQEVSKQLSVMAVMSPSAYINALQAMKKLLSGSSKALSVQDLSSIQKALQRMLSGTHLQPVKTHNGEGMQLSKQYFINLKKQQ